MPDPNEIRLSALRAEVGLFPSVSAFAKQYGLDVTYIRQLLNGHRSFGERAAINMGKAVKSDPMYFGLSQIEKRSTKPNATQEPTEKPPEKQYDDLSYLEDLSPARAKIIRAQIALAIAEEEAKLAAVDPPPQKIPQSRKKA